ncbi:PIN domain-containing protein [Rhizobium puerariae]|uniref:Ribonuclease VapC n=1 Tax=Rhizobium puerariae TaxID=1585791 RepID=A0ABV6AQD3_9HYPH
MAGAFEVIGIDANVLVRFLVDDDPEQNAAARRFLSGRTADDPAFVSALVIAETAWVLNRRLKYPMPVVSDLLLDLISADGLVVEYTEELDALLSVAQPKADFADYLIFWSARRAGCRSVVTFDETAAKAIPGMELLA